MYTRTLFAIVLILGLSSATTSDAQVNPNYTLRVVDTTGSVGGTADVDFTMTNAGDVTGWSWSVCHTGEVSIGGDSDIVPSTLVDDAETLFTSETAEADGFVVAVVLDIGPPQEFIPAGGGQLVYTVTYDLDAEGNALLTYCETVGTPTTPLAVADADGLEVIPLTYAGQLTIDGDAEFKFSVASQTVMYDFEAPDGVSFTTSVGITEDSDNAGYPRDAQGFKISLAHDRDILTVTDVDLGNTELEDMNDGAGPVFFGANLSPDLGDGFTVGCVFSFMADEFMTFGVEKAVIDATYDVDAGELGDAEFGLQTTLSFDDNLGDPIVINAVAVDDIETGDVAGYGTVITFSSGSETLMLRGDVDGDGVVSALLDAQFGLNWVFADGDEPGCHDSMDINDDGIISALVDMLNLLYWAFGDGAPPASPGTVVCGIDATADTLTCLEGSDGC